MSYRGIEEVVVSPEMEFEEFKRVLASSENPRVSGFLCDVQVRIGELIQNNKDVAYHRQKTLEAVYAFYRNLRNEIGHIQIGDIERIIAEEVREEDQGFIAIGPRHIYRNHVEMARAIADAYKESL